MLNCISIVAIYWWCKEWPTSCKHTTTPSRNYKIKNWNNRQTVDGIPSSKVKYEKNETAGLSGPREKMRTMQRKYN